MGLATQTAPAPAHTPSMLRPTRTVRTTSFVRAEMTDSVPSGRFATHTPSPATAIAPGSRPTRIDAEPFVGPRVDAAHRAAVGIRHPERARAGRHGAGRAADGDLPLEDRSAGSITATWFGRISPETCPAVRPGEQRPGGDEHERTAGSREERRTCPPARCGAAQRRVRGLRELRCCSPSATRDPCAALARARRRTRAAGRGGRRSRAAAVPRDARRSPPPRSDRGTACAPPGTRAAGTRASRGPSCGEAIRCGSPPAPCTAPCPPGPRCPIVWCCRSPSCSARSRTGTRARGRRPYR